MCVYLLVARLTNEPLRYPMRQLSSCKCFSLPGVEPELTGEATPPDAPLPDSCMATPPEEVKPAVMKVEVVPTCVCCGMFLTSYPHDPGAR